ncbi:MAG: sulfite exporter TauE/SafE family protein [Neisseriaceae bacterium]|nr:sulfite exporter TauE/SafE family protein [Neisseriaceae bacterium]
MQTLAPLTIFLLILAGSFSGFAAGMLGIGGGVVVVSALVYLFHGQFGASEYLQHTAVGTAFAVMVVTGLVNVFAQKKSQNVDWAVCKKFAPFLFIGVVVGSIFTLGLPEKVLRIIFVLFLYYVSVKMFLSNPKPHTVSDTGLASVGGGIGVFSSWVGIGGGALMVPFFRYYGLSAHHAIGTSGVLTFPVAVAGAVTNLSAGLHIQNNIPNTIGFVYVPGLIVLSICTALFVPLGSWAKTKLSQTTLKRLFGGMNITIAILMTIKLFAI